MAQSGFDAHGLHLAPNDGDVRDPLVVQRPGAFTQWDSWFAMVFEYADAPLVEVRTSPDGSVEEVPIVDDLVVANLSTGLAVHDRVRLDLALPYTFVARGVREISVGDVAFGDLRLAAMTALVRPAHRDSGGGPGLGLVTWLDLPTGRPALLLGNGGVAGGAKLAFTAESDIVTFTADAGTAFKPPSQGLASTGTSDELQLGAALGARLAPTTGLTFETAARLPFATSDVPGTGSPTEGILSLRQHADEHVHVTLGGATAFSQGAGGAAWRVFFGVGYRAITPAAPPDSDPIGTVVVHDKCPAEAEVVNGWRDDDGCPDSLAALQVNVVWRGQPMPGAALTITGPNGVQDAVSSIGGTSLEALPGSSWHAIATLEAACLAGQGSATAADGPTELRVTLDRVAEANVRVEVITPDGSVPEGATVTMISSNVACVPAGLQTLNAGVGSFGVGRGTHTVLVQVPGYAVYQEEVTLVPGAEAVVRVNLAPTVVRITAERIEIDEKVHFETGRAVIKSDSFGLLEEVAHVIIAHPDVGRVEVAGHTDNRGGDAFNQTLSQRRAEAVLEFIVNAGVPAERLLAVGYGEAEPIESNRTDEGRAANRRVEFRLVDRTKSGEDTP
ncbi:MAG: OOP family OmpA-OmpF porin [Myxococcota bacterium]|jgi:OOP family OmpA-OmpF porin